MTGRRRPRLRRTVVEADETGVTLDRTAFCVAGGGTAPQHRALRWDAGEAHVVEVRKRGDGGGTRSEGDVPPLGALIHGEIDWERRHALMRRHTRAARALRRHREHWGKAVAGGDMQPLSARMDFEFGPLPETSPAT